MIIYENYNIKNLTTLSVNNIAKIVFEVINAYEIYLLKYIFDYFNIPYHVLGKGSKVLFKEEYINKPIILIRDKYEELLVKENEIIVSAGYDIKKLILRLSNLNLGGFHYLYPIPASIGGMVYMNASDNKVCISDYIDKIIVIDDKNNLITLSNEECNFSYRSSLFKNKKYIILYCYLKVKSIDKNVIVEQIKDSINYRIKHQEINKSTCGSLFKNPLHFKAYELINKIKNNLPMDNKLYLSSKHSNFLVNNGANSNQIINFIDSIKKQVYQKFNIVLEEEVNILY